MKSFRMILLALAMGALTVTAEEGFFSPLKPGMFVTIQDKGSGFFSILIYKGLEVGYKVLEVSEKPGLPAYVVLQVAEGAPKIRIPATAIREISVMDGMPAPMVPLRK